MAAIYMTIQQSAQFSWKKLLSRIKLTHAKVNANLNPYYYIWENSILSTSPPSLGIRFIVEGVQQFPSPRRNKVEENMFQVNMFSARNLSLMFCCATPIWTRDGAFGVYQQRLLEVYFPTQKTSHHLELCSSSNYRFGGRCPGC